MIECADKYYMQFFFTLKYILHDTFSMIRQNSESLLYWL